jgi:4-amino-4-deoxy-L-arabinose transferase-like glycosyltransferase
MPLLGFFILLALSTRLVPSHTHLLFQLGLTYVVASWAITIAAIVLALRSQRMGQSQKIFWAVALLLLNMFALPVFWFKCLRGSAHVQTT